MTRAIYASTYTHPRAICTCGFETSSRVLSTFIMVSKVTAETESARGLRRRASMACRLTLSMTMAQGVLGIRGRGNHRILALPFGGCVAHIDLTLQVYMHHELAGYYDQGSHVRPANPPKPGPKQDLLPPCSTMSPAHDHTLRKPCACIGRGNSHEPELDV